MARPRDRGGRGARALESRDRDAGRLAAVALADLRRLGSSRCSTRVARPDARRLRRRSRMARVATGLLACLLCGASVAPPQLRVVGVPIARRARLHSLARPRFQIADLRSIVGTLPAPVLVSPETKAP